MKSNFEMLNSWKDKRICILGFAREGISTYHWLRKHFGNIHLSIIDQRQEKDFSPDIASTIANDKHLTLYLGKNYLSKLKNFDVVIRSPGVPYENVKRNIKKNTVISSQTEIFFHVFSGKIIGITGTKGKSTTTSLIYEMLKSIYKTVLVGNIGIPPLKGLEASQGSDVAVMELSSHQLHGINQSPNIAVLLNIFPEHLDYYKDYKSYRAAKANITHFQTKEDILVYNAACKPLLSVVRTSKAKKISFSLSCTQPADACVKGAKMYVGKMGSRKRFVSFSQSKLIGVFNHNNLLAAVLVAQEMNIPTNVIQSAIDHFQPLPHRLEMIATKSKVHFINDSLATVPQSAAEAINACGAKLQTVLLGGYDRGIDQTPLVQMLAQSNVEIVLCFPDTGDEILNKLKNKQKDCRYIRVRTMEQAVRKAFELTNPGKYCLLSPGAASFNIFKDYADRGDQFKFWVKKLDNNQAF